MRTRLLSGGTWICGKTIVPSGLTGPQLSFNFTVRKEDKGVVQMEKVMNIEGMVCGNCVKHVDKALREIEGITQVEVSLEKKMAQVQLNQDVPDDVLKTAVEEAGYQVVSIQ
ncbi:MAG TPA: heavy-metal-associated domain-containing protein [Candidatus Scybalocola faecipullorum]|nr:heavy-metal-associated domain-containing protein [Candidatus Scybalocola faecipullorum]